MIVPNQKFLIDGIDRLGKSSLINAIQNEMGYHLVIHYDKPKSLDYYSLGVSKNAALEIYQYATNASMFDLMKTDIPIIFDRTHLGELVYAPMYRGYQGDYVLQMERHFVNNNLESAGNTRLILLTTSNFDMLEDDGLSFDFTKKEEEQKKFIDAFERSNLPNKVMVDVHNGNGGYKSYTDVFIEALFKK